MSLSDASQAEWPPELILPGSRPMPGPVSIQGLSSLLDSGVREQVLGLCRARNASLSSFGLSCDFICCEDAFPQQLRPEGIGMRPALFQSECLSSLALQMNKAIRYLFRGDFSCAASGNNFAAISSSNGQHTQVPLHVQAHGNPAAVVADDGRTCNASNTSPKGAESHALGSNFSGGWNCYRRKWECRGRRYRRLASRCFE